MNTYKNKFKLIIYFILIYMSAITTAFSEEAASKNQYIEINKKFERLDYEVRSTLQQNKELVQSKVELAQAIANEAKMKTDSSNFWLNWLTILLGVITLFSVLIPYVLVRKQATDFDKEINTIKNIFKDLKELEKEKKLEIDEILKRIATSESKIAAKVKNLENFENKAISHSKAIEDLKNTLIDKSDEVVKSASTQLGEIKNSPIATLSAKALEFSRAGNLPEAIVRWKSLTDIDPAPYSHWFNIGYAYQEIADKTTGDSKIENLVNASQAYQEAIRLKPDEYAVYSNWGNIYLEQAKLKVGDEADRLFDQAYNKYKEAIKLNPNAWDAFNNLGCALFEQAQQKSGQDVQNLFELAQTNYTEAVKCNHLANLPFHNWGMALAYIAKSAEDKESDRLFDLAYEKLQKSINLNIDYFDSYAVWGNALLDQAKLKNGNTAKRKYEDALNKLEKADSLSTGYSAYNIACIKSLMHSPQECFHWLDVSKNNNYLPSKTHLLNDNDLINVRDETWFINFINELTD